MELGIDVITPKNINDQEVYELLDELNPDFIVVVAYGQIIKKKILDRFKNKILNVHASILPKYRGASPINYSLINGDEKNWSKHNVSRRRARFWRYISHR